MKRLIDDYRTSCREYPALCNIYKHATIIDYNGTLVLNDYAKVIDDITLLYYNTDIRYSNYI